MTEQCKIYLDPWDKTDLEGTAMLINRMPDIDERTYRSVTCQRWLVRFLPDQDNAMRWLDYNDAETYEYPYLTPHVFTLAVPSIAINDASPACSFLSAHAVQLTWWPGIHVAAFIMPHDGFLRGYSIMYTTVGASGGSNPTMFTVRKNDVWLDGLTLAHSTTPGGPYSADFHRTPPRTFADGDKITAGLTGPQPAGEDIELSNIIASLFCAWD